MLMTVIQFLRNFRGMTVGELSQACGIRCKDIARMENGDTHIAIYKVVAIARYFQVSADALLRQNFLEISYALTTPAYCLNKLQQQYETTKEHRQDIGIIGEQAAYYAEQQRNRNTPWANMVNPNYAQDPTAHFDILGFCGNGLLKPIEVKATAGEKENDFYMSACEVDAAKRMLQSGYCYQLHRVYHALSPQKRQIEIIDGADLFDADKFEFIPYSYRVRRKVV